MEDIHERINYIFSNSLTRTCLLFLSGMFIGYVLQPVPKWLNNLFTTSQIFKFFVLVTVGIVASYPVNKLELTNIVLGSIIVLVILQVMRKLLN